MKIEYNMGIIFVFKDTLNVPNFTQKKFNFGSFGDNFLNISLWVFFSIIKKNLSPVVWDSGIMKFSLNFSWINHPSIIKEAGPKQKAISTAIKQKIVKTTDQFDVNILIVHRHLNF